MNNYCLLCELGFKFNIRITSYYLLHESRVTISCTSYELLFTYKLRVTDY